jgi:pyruvate carboxylase
LNWDEIFDYVGFPAYLKPHSGGGWKHVYRVNSHHEFFAAYDQTGTLCMTLQQAIEFDQYFRCYVVGQEKVHVMRYDPKRPHHERYVQDPAPVETKLNDRIVDDALKLCRALGYDLNTVEFAVQDGVPYAIDFLNPAPDADYQSVGPDNFSWIVKAVAELAVEKAQSDEQPVTRYHWSYFLSGGKSTAQRV